ncbi:MAG: tetratricopeptide repeat protein [Calditrichaeota bacterium]|nr:MAG: tetratricopeptide repeat protein [Calditrichota bacterium]
MRQGRPSKKRKRTKTPNFSSPAPLSLCMIVKNEEQFLEGCLKSVEGLVSEIIIVDTGSTDATLDIASRFKTRIFTIRWENHFARARNYALEKATQPWILYLDADERLHPPFHQTVKKAIQSDQADAYYLQVYSEVGQLLGGIPHIQAYPRLFKKLPGVQFEGRIHEQITPSLLRVNARIEYLDVQIEHLGYNLPEEVLRQKVQRNLDFLHQQVEEEPENAYAWFQLGQTTLIAGKKEEAIQYLNRTLELSEPSSQLSSAAQMIIANELFLQKDYPGAIHILKQVLEATPRQRLGWFLLSECYAHLQQFDKALQALKEVKKYGQLKFTDLNIDKLFESYLLEQRFALYLFSVKRYKEAIPHFYNYFTQAPHWNQNLLGKYLVAYNTTGHDSDKHQRLIKMFIDQLSRFHNPQEAVQILGSFFEQKGDSRTLLTLFKAASKQFPTQPVYPYYAGNACLKMGDYAQANRYYFQALSLDDSIYEIHYNLAVSHIKSGRYQDAIEQFLKIREQFPQHAQEANRRLGGLYLKLGMVDEAVKIAQQNLTDVS